MLYSTLLSYVVMVTAFLTIKTVVRLACDELLYEIKTVSRELEIGDVILLCSSEL